MIKDTNKITIQPSVNQSVLFARMTQYNINKTPMNSSSVTEFMVLRALSS